MIPQWQAALDRGLKFLAPRGALHIVDFGSQSGLPNWFRDGLRHWLSLFEVTPRDGLEAVLTARGTGTLFSLERPFRDCVRVVAEGGFVERNCAAPSFETHRRAKLLRTRWSAREQQIRPHAEELRRSAS